MEKYHTESAVRVLKVKLTNHTTLYDHQEFTVPDQINGYHLCETTNGENIKDFIRKELSLAKEAGVREGRNETVDKVIGMLGEYGGFTFEQTRAQIKQLKALTPPQEHRVEPNK